jgi:hypothetical protein
MGSTAADGTRRSAPKELRAVAMTWAAAAIVPLPVLVVAGPTVGGDLSCLYLGLGCGWLVTEFHRTLGSPVSLPAWRTRMLAVALAVTTNVVLFISFGIAAGVPTHFPFPLMAALSAVPAVGMTPWLVRRSRNPHAAILLGGMLVLAAKLAACVVARIVYGPDYMAQGYVAADWRTAKLMISLFWSFTTLLSLAFFVADYVVIKGPRPTAAVTIHEPPVSPAAGGAV